MNERIFFIPGVKMFPELYKGWNKALAGSKRHKVFKSLYMYNQHKKVLALRNKVLKALEDGEPTVLVGHSFGGIVAIAVAAEAKKKGLKNIARVVTMASPHGIEIVGVKETKELLGYSNKLSVPVYSFGGLLDPLVLAKFAAYPGATQHINIPSTHSGFLYPNDIPAQVVWPSIYPPQEVTSEAIASFAKTVWAYYSKYGRHNLPWRKTTNAYRIAVSEVMLQQTQVARVKDHYKRWLKAYPSLQALAKAPFKDVLAHWQGLGYNRRAKHLHTMARELAKNRHTMPTNAAGLEALPGVGEYTAGAITAFAFNKPGVFLETNIRTALIYHFFPREKKVSERKLKAVLEQCLQEVARARANPREWYWALMDYGAFLKKTVGNSNRQSTSYTKQSAFEGSRRQVQAAIVKYLVGQKGPVTKSELREKIERNGYSLGELLLVLEREGIISQTKKGYMIQ